MFNPHKKLEKVPGLSKIYSVPKALSIPELSYSGQGSNLSRAPSVPVIGRKLSSESIITVNEDFCKQFPLAIDTIPRRVAKPVMLNKAASTTKLNTRPNAIKVVDQAILSNSSRKSSVLVKSKTFAKLKKRKNKVEVVTNNFYVKSPKSYDDGKILKTLVSKSLKHYKNAKKLAQKSEKSRKEAKTKLKNEVKALSIITRKENLKHFKTRTFKPKFPWGVDEKRIEKSSEKRREVNYSENFPQKSIKRLKLYKKSIASPSPEETPLKKCVHSSRPEIKSYLKHQRLSRKRSKEQEQSKKLEKESRRILQLKVIDVVSKQILEKQQKKVKKKKSPKKILKRCKPIKWIQRNLEDFSENDLGANKDLSNSESYLIDKRVRIQSEGSDYQEKFGRVEGSSGRSESSANGFGDIESPRSPGLLVLEEFKKRKQNKQEEFGKKLEIAKQKLNGFGEEREKAAIRLQAAVRGWLARKNLNKMILKFVAFDDSNSWMYKKLYPESPDSFNEEDDEVKKILGVFHMDDKDNSFSPLRFKDPPKEDFTEYSPIFKGQDLNFSDIASKTDTENKEKTMPNTQKKTILQEKLPKYDKIKETTMNLFRFIVYNQLNKLYEIPDMQKSLALEYLKNLLSTQHQKFTQEFHQILENLSNNLSLLNFRNFLKDYPDFQEILNDQFHLLDQSSESLFSHDSPEPILPHPKFISNILPCLKANIESVPLIPVYKENSLSCSFDVFSDALGEDFFELLFDSVLMILHEILFKDLVDDVFCQIIKDTIEKFIIGLVEHEVILRKQELSDGISDENLMNYTDFIFKAHGEEIFQNLKIDRREEPLEVLSCMQESEIGSGAFQEYFEEILVTQTFLETIPGDPLQVCIYKKMIFDCINEGLFPQSYQSPMPWSLDRKKPIKIESSEEVYCKIISLLLKWNTCKLGKLFSSFTALGINELTLNKLREERILAVLFQESKESDLKWINYEFEEIQLRLDISDMVLELLVEEIMESFIN